MEPQYGSYGHLILRAVYLQLKEVVSCFFQLVLQLYVNKDGQLYISILGEDIHQAPQLEAWA